LPFSLFAPLISAVITAAITLNSINHAEMMVHSIVVSSKKRNLTMENLVEV